MTDKLDISLNASALNTSKKSLICNHCMYDCQTYENMKDHYRSDFHKYNLNRVTMNLNPLTFPEYQKKKEIYQKIHEAKAKPVANLNQSVALDSLKCDVCHKAFASMNKFNEHMISKAHKKKEEELKTNPVVVKTEKKKPEEEEKTTLDDVNICLFCNAQNSSIEGNIIHMIDAHKFDVPLIFCVKNAKGMLRLMAKKIMTYVACLTCDCQNFKNYKSLQNHMIDKGHTSVNEEDLEEFLYKFYDKKSLLSIKDKSLKKLKEYKILKIKLKMKKTKKAVKEEDEEQWKTDSEGEDDKQKTKIIKSNDIDKELEDSDSEDEYEPVTLPNGELLLENGTIVGNKIYQTYYKQRFHNNKYEGLIDTQRVTRMRQLKAKPQSRKRTGPSVKYYTIKESNKSSFIRINTLFKACKQVNV